MKEILFRGKGRDDGEWAEGFLYITHKGEHEISRYLQSLDIERWTRVVIPNTVGQFTGLKDKNGKKIFEGDIIKYNYNTYIGCKDRARIGRIEYIEDLSRFYINLDGDTYDDFGAVVAQHCKIIGNVHDNPELLK